MQRGIQSPHLKECLFLLFPFKKVFYPIFHENFPVCLGDTVSQFQDQYVFPKFKISAFIFLNFQRPNFNHPHLALCHPIVVQCFYWEVLWCWWACYSTISSYSQSKKRTVIILYDHSIFFRMYVINNQSGKLWIQNIYRGGGC